MPRRPLPVLLLVICTAVSQAGAAAAQELVLLAFGDSITDGAGDTSNLGGGYTRRLERSINDQGYFCAVENYGVGGEKTVQGLSRIDDVLAGGGDYLLLMEGTNDISRHVSVETITFNLDEMAARAEALGIIAVHATVIPRFPAATVDADNSTNSALAGSIRALAQDSQRAVVDNYAEFWRLPNLFENYYYDFPGDTDPVGHPNTNGYIEMAGFFLDTLLPLLAAPSIEILPPVGPIASGSLTAFGIGGVGEFVRVEWEFGDGGFAVTSPPSDLLALYLYLHPGTYTVSVRGFTAEGAISQHSVSVVVAGTEPAWATRTALLPVVVESNDGLIVSDLRLANSGTFFAIAEATFLPEVNYDTAPPVRRLLVPAQDSTTLTEILATAFGVGTGRGAMKLTFYVDPSGSPGALSATALVHSPADPEGTAGATVGEISSADWSASAKQILDIPYSAGAPATIDVANLDGTEGSVRLDLFDDDDGYIGSGVLELAANSARLRSLSDLFRDLGQRPAPFRAVLAPASVRFSTAALIADPASGEVLVLTGTP